MNKEVLSSFLFFSMIVMNASAADVTLDTTALELYKDQTFDVNISVDPQGEGIAGVQLDLDFDGDKLQVISVKEGNLLNGNGAKTYFAALKPGANSISNIIGFILENSSIVNPGVFAVIRFKSTDAGNSILKLRNVKVSNPGGNLLKAETPGNTILKVASNTTGDGEDLPDKGNVSDEDLNNIELIEKYDRFIYKDMTTSYRFKSEGNPVTYVNVTGKINAGEITTSVEVLRNTSSLVKNAPGGIIYRNVSISVGPSGFSRNIENAVVTFRVTKSWINENNIDPRSIALMHYSDSWNELRTEKIGENGAEIHYEARTDSFSYFAITGREFSIRENNGIAPAGQEKIQDNQAENKEPENQSDLNTFLLVGTFVGSTLNASLIFFKIMKLKLASDE